MKHWLLIMGLCAMAPMAGCRRAADPGNDRETIERSMAILGTVRALHHEADVYESNGQFDLASHAIQRVIDLRLPESLSEAEDVRADAWGRMAELDLRRQRPDEALAHTDQGLRAAPHESVLQARIYMVRGQALRALADRAAATADSTATATRLREEALTALEHSIEINTRILGRLTPGASR
jgi:tetratricopeptide (TPR) repeat protein